MACRVVQAGYHSRAMATKSSATKQHSGRRETFNQIMLMLILAFTFRVFVVEAFVIPTGSMAPTLKGAHARFVCENCGYHYDVNYSSPNRSGTEINIPRTATRRDERGRVFREEWRVYCPNCGFQAGSDQASAPRIYYGDRILVLKYQYLLESPKRWDVIVFKTPADPSIYHYNQAYIKRLVGLPGESVMILDGDIYVAGKANAAASDWQIQRKNDVVQDALWRIVNDTDYAPQGLTPESGSAIGTRTAESYIPWRSADGTWRYTVDPTGARSFNFGDEKGSGTLRLERLSDLRRQPQKPLTDWLAYDQRPHEQMPGQVEFNPVSDLKLALSYARLAGAGPLEMSLSKRDDIFTARLLPDAVEIVRATVDDPTSTKVVARKEWRFGSRPARVEFMNLDYQVRLLIDGQEVLATTPEQYSPDVAGMMRDRTMPPYPMVSITARQQVCGITHMSLWRDVYYTVRGGQILRGGPDRPVVLGPEEYFAIGDNSPLSQDGRYWADPVSLPNEEIYAQAGVVPAKFLLGKALLVYWPAGYRLYYDGAPDLIPNFGEMRFIH